MKPLNKFTNSSVRFVFTDIDDTLTDKGQLGAEAYKAVWDLFHAGLLPDISLQG